jgi:nitrous oxide reductase accessory protein NosL
MKRGIIAAVCAAVLVSVFALTACAETDIDRHRECKQCGMDRKAYGYSRMLVQYKDGQQVGTCSLHCVVTELDSGKGGEVAAIQVADRDTHKLIDAEKAVWVIGGKKRGVMTMRAKWAFASREAAQKFVDSYGGVLAEWKKALVAAREDAGNSGGRKAR